MATRESADFLAGVIEGFYGQPWTQRERFELFDWMARWGLNTYLYAPKDDLKHRAIWREPYSAVECETLGELIRACQQRDIRFLYGLSPGLDIGYRSDTDLGHLRRRFEQLATLGCRHFALLFDDIPDRMDDDDLKRWGSLASAQSHVANAMCQWTRQQWPEARLWFCPTAYCGRMAELGLGGKGYLPALGRELLPEIDVFWTGPEIVSREITVDHVREIQGLLGRKPLIWDNLHANDYDGRRFFCGPYAGRPPALRAEVRGLLLNPNNEFPLNYVPLRTLAAFVQSEAKWDARAAYLSAMQEWSSFFQTTMRDPRVEDLVLFGDCYYLPHGEGPEAEALVETALELLGQKGGELNDRVAAFGERAVRLRDFCARLANLRHRPLFYALSRRVWELREELDLLLGYMGWAGKHRNPSMPFRSDSHLPGTYRGGMVARLQRVLEQHPDGSFTPALPRAGRTVE